MVSRGLLVLATLLLCATTSFAKDPSTVSASDKAAARAAMDRGDELMAKDKPQEALAEYQAADQLMGVPSTGVLVGKAYEALGKLVEAHDAYLAVGRYRHTPGKPMPDVFVKAKKLAAERTEALDAKMPTLKIVLSELPSDVTAKIAINGEPINAAALTRRVNPGSLTVTASADGYLNSSGSATLAEGETKTVTLTLQKDPNAVGTVVPPTPTPTTTPTPTPEPEGGDQTTGGGGNLVPAIIAFSVGGVGLVLGGVFGGLTFGKKGDLEAACEIETECNEQDLIDEANTFANVSNVGFAVGGVGVVVGVVLLFTLGFDDEAEAAGITPIVSPDMMGISGRF